MPSLDNKLISPLGRKIEAKDLRRIKTRVILKHLPGQHDQKTHGSWANGNSSPDPKTERLWKIKSEMMRAFARFSDDPEAQEAMDWFIERGVLVEDFGSWSKPAAARFIKETQSAAADLEAKGITLRPAKITLLGSDYPTFDRTSLGSMYDNGVMELHYRHGIVGGSPSSDRNPPAGFKFATNSPYDSYTHEIGHLVDLWSEPVQSDQLYQRFGKLEGSRYAEISFTSRAEESKSKFLLGGVADARKKWGDRPEYVAEAFTAAILKPDAIPSELGDFMLSEARRVSGEQAKIWSDNPFSDGYGRRHESRVPVAKREPINMCPWGLSHEAWKRDRARDIIKHADHNQKDHGNWARGTTSPSADDMPEWFDPDEFGPHVLGVDSDGFVVVDAESDWLPSDNEGLYWHGTTSKVTDDYLSSASTLGGHYDDRYETIEDWSGRVSWEGKEIRDPDYVWAGTPKQAQQYMISSAGPEGVEYWDNVRLYGLDADEAHGFMDGYAIPEDEHEIVARYRFVYSDRLDEVDFQKHADHNQESHGNWARGYRGHHQPSASYGAPAHDLEVLVSGDIYTHPHYYPGHTDYPEVMRTIKGLRGKPDAEVTIYRAVPKGVDKINPGDWVTPSREYARTHGEHNLPKNARGGNEWHIVERSVTAKELIWPGDYIPEWGWFPGGLQSEEDIGKHAEHDQKSHGNWARGPRGADVGPPRPRPERDDATWAEISRLQAADDHDAASVIFDEIRQEKNQWQRDIRYHLSVGNITPDQAAEFGYTGSGHDQSGRGWGPHSLTWQPLPEQLYHVTTAADAVYESGLMSRDELNMARGMGLGGGESDTISFTADRETAEAIHAGLLEAQQVAQGNITVNDMVNQARTDGWLPQFVSYWNSDWKEGDPLPDGLQGLMNNEKLESWMGANLPTIEEVTNKGWRPAYTTSTGYVYRAWRPMTADEITEYSFDTYKTFSALREGATGRMDPMFFLTDVPGLAETDPEQIQVMEFTPKPGAMGYPLGAMREWRTATGDAVDLVGTVKKGARPKKGGLGLARFSKHPGPDGSEVHATGSPQTVHGGQRALFHGTSFKNAAAIEEAGFDLNVGPTNGRVWGDGVYLAAGARDARGWADQGHGFSDAAIVEVEVDDLNILPIRTRHNIRGLYDAFTDADKASERWHRTAMYEQALKDFRSDNPPEAVEIMEKLFDDESLHGGSGGWGPRFARLVQEAGYDAVEILPKTQEAETGSFEWMNTGGHQLVVFANLDKLKVVDAFPASMSPDADKKLMADWWAAPVSKKQRWFLVVPLKSAKTKKVQKRAGLGIRPLTNLAKTVSNTLGISKHRSPVHGTGSSQKVHGNWAHPGYRDSVDLDTGTIEVWDDFTGQSSTQPALFDADQKPTFDIDGPTPDPSPNNLTPRQRIDLIKQAATDRNAIGLARGEERASMEAEWERKYGEEIGYAHKFIWEQQTLLNEQLRARGAEIMSSARDRLTLSSMIDTVTEHAAVKGRVAELTSRDKIPRLISDDFSGIEYARRTFGDIKNPRRWLYLPDDVADYAENLIENPPPPPEWDFLEGEDNPLYFERVEKDGFNLSIDGDTTHIPAHSYAIKDWHEAFGNNPPPGFEFQPILQYARQRALWSESLPGEERLVGGDPFNPYLRNLSQDTTPIEGRPIDGHKLMEALRDHKTYWNKQHSDIWDTLSDAQQDESRLNLKLKNAGPAALMHELKQVREFGGDPVLTSKRAKIYPTFEAMTNKIPSDWIETANEAQDTPLRLLTKEQRAHYEVRAVSGPYYDTKVNPTITLAEYDSIGVHAHEFMHHLERHVPELAAASDAWYSHKTEGEAGDTMQNLLPGFRYGSNEWSRPDEFGHPYMGRNYPGKNWELMSMATERLLFKPWHTGEITDRTNTSSLGSRVHEYSKYWGGDRWPAEIDKETAEWAVGVLAEL